MYLGLRAQWNNNMSKEFFELDDQQKCERLGMYHGHPNYGSSMLMPVLLCLIFTFIQWWYMDGDLRTLPLVFLLCWPIYRLGRILYYGLWKKDDKRWNAEYELYNRNVFGIGTYYVTALFAIYENQDLY